MTKPSWRGTDQLNVRLTAGLIDEIDKFCDTNGLLKKEVIELALRRFLAAERGKSPHVPNALDTGQRLPT